MGDELSVKSNDVAVRYSVKTKTGWGVPMTGLDADDGSNLDHAGIIGEPMTNFKIGGKFVEKARVKTIRGKWLEYGSGFDTELGNDTDIIGIEIVGEGLIVSAHIKGGQWLNPIYTSSDKGVATIVGGAVLDAIWIDKV